MNKPKKESNIQNAIRLAASESKCTLFRVNVGTGVTGNGQIRHANGDVTVKNARPFSTGVPKGYSDLSGYKKITITEDMVGKQIAQAVFLEVKTETGKIRPEQVNFIEQAQKKGAIAGVVRSVEDFRELVK